VLINSKGVPQSQSVGPFVGPRSHTRSHAIHRKIYIPPSVYRYMQRSVAELGNAVGVASYSYLPSGHRWMGGSLTRVLYGSSNLPTPTIIIGGTLRGTQVPPNSGGSHEIRFWGGPTNLAKKKKYRGKSDCPATLTLTRRAWLLVDFYALSYFVFQVFP